MCPFNRIKRLHQRFPATPKGRYYALLNQLDHNISKVLAALESTQQADNTLVIIVSDNGGTNEQVDNNYPYSGTKYSYDEGGVHTPMLARWPGVLPANEVYEHVVSILRHFPDFSFSCTS